MRLQKQKKVSPTTNPNSPCFKWLLFLSPCLLILVTVMACGGGALNWDQLDDGRDLSDEFSEYGTESGDDDSSNLDDDSPADLFGGGSDVGDQDPLEFEDCTALSEVAQNVYEPVDVIVVIDNTPSMYNEIQEVRENLNRLSETVRARGLNMRLVLISCLSLECLEPHDDCEFPPCWHSICLPPPLGAEGGCPYVGDSNPPDFLHIDQRVESLKALENIIETYDQWASFLRENVPRHIIVISDDNDYWNPDTFTEQLLELDPNFEDYKFHGIYSYEDKFKACQENDASPCCIFAAPDGEGTVYRDLVEMTGGVSGDLCLQDFDPVFDLITEAILQSVDMSCEWVLPDPPDGYLLDPELVNLQFIDDDGNTRFIGQVDSADDCSSVAHGWYYDDPEDPTGVFVCNQTCEAIQDQEGMVAKILFGCETVPEPLI